MSERIFPVAVVGEDYYRRDTFWMSTPSRMLINSPLVTITAV